MTSHTNWYPYQQQVYSSNACYHAVKNYISSQILPKNVRSEVKFHFTHCFLWVLNLVPHIQTKQQTAGVWKQGV
jgi:hypothetical protein